MKNISFLIITIALTFLSTANGDSDEDCVYTLYVKTGSKMRGGTDSKISVAIGDAAGNNVSIPVLRSWGLMGHDHDYFERGNVDIFTGRGPCINAPICRLTVSSDGSGRHHSWYCEYVEVTSTGNHRLCHQSLFNVERWLSKDRPPYELTAVIDGCKSNATHTQGGAAAPLHRIKRGPFVMGKPCKISDA